MRAAGLALVLTLAVAVMGGGARAEAAGKVPAATAG